MEHLILVLVMIFPGEKTLVSRPGAVPRLPRCMVQGHLIKRASDQTGSFRAEDFRVSGLRDRLFQS